MPSADRVLEVSNLRKTFRGPRRAFGRKGLDVHAVRAVSFRVGPGQTLGIVGETGSGKSTVARCLSGLTPPSSGTMTWGEFELGALSDALWRVVRRRLQIVVQNPYASLDPRMSALDIVREPLMNYRLGSPIDQRNRAAQVLGEVGLGRAECSKRPGQLSGGQRQRVAIARALVLDPDLLILDEPVSALDVSIQAQVINLLLQLQAARRLSLIVILHDLAVARYLCETVMVMHEGQVVEQGATDSILQSPQDAYTRALIRASPEL